MSARHYLSYTYFLKWTILNKKYYGSRVANEVEPRKDLLIKYDTSSDPVKRLLKLFGKPDVIRVDKTFTDEPKTLKYEIQVLKENDVLNDPTWLNQHIPGEDFTMSGRKHSKETKMKQRDSKLGKNNPNYGKELKKEHRDKISNSNKNPSKETRIKKSNSQKGENNSFYGKNHKKESIQKIKKNRKGKCIGKHNPMYGIPSSNRRKIKVHGIVFESLKKAAEYHNVYDSTICKWAKKGKAEYI